MARLVAELDPERHFGTDKNDRNVFLTDEGHKQVQDLLGCGDIHESANRLLATRLNQSLHARALLTRDVDYIVRDGRVTIMMPHPERVAQTKQNSWHPDEWGEDGPWMRMFRNARVAVG